MKNSENNKNIKDDEEIDHEYAQQHFTCTQQMKKCKIESQFDNDEWSALSIKCSQKDAESCKQLKSKYDGEQGAFIKYKKCLDQIEECKEKYVLGRELVQLAGFTSMNEKYLPYIGGMIANGQLGRQIWDLYANKKNVDFPSHDDRKNPVQGSMLGKTYEAESIKTKKRFRYGHFK